MTDKVTLSNVSSFTNDTSAVAVVNGNMAAITTAMDNTLSRNGASPNQMGASLDMNSNQILNLPAPSSANSPIRFQDLDTLQAGGTVVTLPVGGTTAQALAKNSSTNYDVSWQTVASVSSVGQAVVTMKPDYTKPSGEPWLVFDPFGNAVSTSGTTTSGLQEAINFAVKGGYPLNVNGHGGTIVATDTGTGNGTTTITGVQASTVSAINAALTNGAVFATGTGVQSFTTVVSATGTSVVVSKTVTSGSITNLKFAQNIVFIACTTGIQMPPIEQWQATFRDVNITFSSAVTGPCWTFDSCMVTDITFIGGQIVGQPASPTGSSYLLYFNPTNPVPFDGIITVTASRFIFPNFGYQATGGTNTAVVAFNVGNGSIDNNYFAFNEINGTGSGATPDTSYGIYAFGTTATNSFEQNIIDASDIHLLSSVGILLGTGAMNDNNIRHNQFRVGGIRPGASAIGIASYGSCNQFTVGGITNEECAPSSLLFGVVYQSGSANEKVSVGNLVSVGTPYSDGGTGNTFEGPGGATKLQFYGSTSGSTAISASATASGVLTLPAATDTLVGRATTDTLTNKTLTTPVISSIHNTGTLTLPTSTDTLVGRATTDTLTNKTIDTAGPNTIKINGNTLSATAGTATITVPNSTDTLVGRATTDTLTNKTLTAPVISSIVNTGTLTLPTSTDTLVARSTTDLLSNKTFPAGTGSGTFAASGKLTTVMGPVGTGNDTSEDTLLTYNIPANTLVTTGQCIRVSAGGNYGANAHNKTVNFYVGGIEVMTSTALAENGTGWYIEAEIYRTGSNAQVVILTGMFGNAIGAGCAFSTLTLTETSTIQIKCTGINGTATTNDVQQYFLKVENIA